MTQYYSPPISKSRLSRITAQLERMEANVSDWAGADEPVPSRDAEWNDDGDSYAPEADYESPSVARSTRSGTWAEAGYPKKIAEFSWENGMNHVIIRERGGILKRLASEMKKQSLQPITLRTRQLSAVCAFIPFVLSVLSAAIRYLPNMPSLTLWSKVTWFIAFPMFLAITGAFVGFLIGIMLESIESQVQNRGKGQHGSSPSEESIAGMAGQPQKSSVWVLVEDLEPNQRVAETVLGENGTPILLRHTLLKPNHLELLRSQKIMKVKVEVNKYPNEGDLALAG